MCLGFCSNNAFAGINPGDILVSDDSTGTDDRGVIFNIDPATGQRTVITDFGNPLQGPIGAEPHDLAMEPDGRICVIDDDVGTDGLGLLFRIFFTDGRRTIISDFGDPAQGPLGGNPQGLALFTNGNLYVTDSSAPNGDGGLFRVDKHTGFRTLVTDLSNAAQGPTAELARDVAEGPGGIIYLITSGGGTDNRGILFQVDPDSGFRTVISDMGDGAQGPTGNARWFAVSQGGVIYVLNNLTPETVLNVDPVTGNRQIVTDFTDAGQGPTEGNVQGIEVDNNSQILVNATQSDLLLSIDPISGIRTVVSDYADPSEGPLGSFGVGIIVAPEIVVAKIPTLNQWGLIAMAGILGIVGFMVIRRRKVGA